MLFWCWVIYTIGPLLEYTFHSSYNCTNDHDEDVKMVMLCIIGGGVVKVKAIAALDKRIECEEKKCSKHETEEQGPWLKPTIREVLGEGDLNRDLEMWMTWKPRGQKHHQLLKRTDNVEFSKAHHLCSSVKKLLTRSIGRCLWTCSKQSWYILNTEVQVWVIKLKTMDDCKKM